MYESQITLADGRVVAFADYGSPDQTAVLWCHGGPGCRFEPDTSAPAAERAGLRLVGIDRPGYGRSTPNPGRTIGGWVPEALAVADHLGIDRFISVGASTGGAYALALAALTDRVIASVACCAVTDMRWPKGPALMGLSQVFWNARDRNEAMALATQLFGADGAKANPLDQADSLSGADSRWFRTPDNAAAWQRWAREMYAQGNVGYVDDRLADGPGWETFDVNVITCPVVVLHGTDDLFAPIANAYHTAEIVPGASLRIVDGAGHLGIIHHMVDAITEALSRVPASGAAR